MAEFTDQTGRKIIVHYPPQRIISLVPSQTELLVSLDLAEQVVGITKFCIHPNEWFRQKTRIGGTKQLNFDLIESLRPDLIIANKEENDREQVEMLCSKYPVWISDITTLDDMYEMFSVIGQLVDRSSAAQLLVAAISRTLSVLPAVSRKPRAAYFIWRDPYMTAGSDTFIHTMMELAGFENVFADQRRYPEVTIGQLRHINCEVLLLSSEPFPFAKKHVDELQQLLPGVKILLVDGEMFSWYGTRLLFAADHFRDIRQQLGTGW